MANQKIAGVVAAMIYGLKAATAIGYSPYGQNRTQASPRHLPFFTTTMMREIFRALYVLVCLINFLNFLMPRFVNMPEAFLPAINENSLQCLIERNFNSQNYGPRNYAEDSAHEDMLDFLKISWGAEYESCPTYSRNASDNNIKRLEMGSFLRKGSASDSDLAKIVSDPCLNIPAGEAVYVDLEEDMQAYSARPFSVRCLPGNTSLFDTYSSLLDHHKPSAATECLKIANILINAPFSHWDKELSAGNFAERLLALGQRDMSISDQAICSGTILYVNLIYSRIKSQGLI